MRMRGRACPEAWACRLLAKLPVPERVGSKVLPIPGKSRFPRDGREEALGEQQEPPRMHAGEVSGTAQVSLAHKIIRQQILSSITQNNLACLQHVTSISKAESH